MSNQHDIIPLKFCDYSDAELMNVIEHLYNNMRSLQNAIDPVRPDIAIALDSIIDNPTMVADVDVKSIPCAACRSGKGDVIIIDRLHNQMVKIMLEFDTDHAREITTSPILDSKATEKKLIKIARRSR